MLLASGFSPVYPCHVSQGDMRTKPVGTGPFKFVELNRNVSIKLVRNPDYWKKGRPYLDAIEMRIIDSRSTRILGFVAGEFDMTFDSDITVPLMKDMAKQAPKAICELRPSNVSTNLIVNTAAPPFDNPQIRKAMALAHRSQGLHRDPDRGQGVDGRRHAAGAGRAMGDAAGGTGQAAGLWRRCGEEPGRSAQDHGGPRLRARQDAQGEGVDPQHSIYRDPGVILIDQLKSIHIDGELDPIDTTVWYAKVQRKDYSVGLNLTGVAVDDPDVNLIENYTCNVGAQLHPVLQPRDRQA